MNKRWTISYKYSAGKWRFLIKRHEGRVGMPPESDIVMILQYRQHFTVEVNTKRFIHGGFFNSRCLSGVGKTDLNRTREDGQELNQLEISENITYNEKSFRTCTTLHE